MLSLSSLAVLVVQRAIGDPDQDVIASLIPALARLQERLNVTSVKIDRLNGALAANTSVTSGNTVALDRNSLALDRNSNALVQQASASNRLARTYETLAVVVAQEKGVPLSALNAILVRFGEVGTESERERIEDILRRKADEYVLLRGAGEALGLRSRRSNAAAGSGAGIPCV